MNERPPKLDDLAAATASAAGDAADLSSGEATIAAPSRAGRSAPASSEVRADSGARLGAAAPDAGDLEARQARVKVAGALFSSPASGAPSGPVRIGRYELLDKLGAGGMGVVYRARDPELEREVALKVLVPDIAKDPTAQRRMLREARALARLSHPHVVQVHDVGTQGEQIFLAMEYVAGSDLQVWLDTAAREPAEVLERFIQAGRGLAAAHAEGMVHRDFKPANVLVGEDGRVRVVDFGLARPVDAEALPMLDGATTQTGALVGTPLYMAPEQFEGRGADARSDQFSFCVALFTALFGARPFVGDHVAAYVSNVVQGRLVRPEALPEGVSPTLLRALERGLEVDPNARFASMEALLEALETGAAAPARAGIGAEPRGESSTGRGPSPVSVAIAAAVGLGALAYVFASAPPERGTASPDAAALVTRAMASSATAPQGVGDRLRVVPDPSTSESGAWQPEGPRAAATGKTATGSGQGPAEAKLGEGTTGVGADSSEDAEPRASTAGDAASAAASRRSASRDFCAFHEDSYRLLRRQKRRPDRFERDGTCYTCKVERRRSRISRLVPNDCGTYMMCAPADAEVCK